MTKLDYLKDPSVAALVDWLAARVDAPGTLHRTYEIRKHKARWTCHSIHSAFENYQWRFKCASLGCKGTTFDDSRIVLEQLQQSLRHSMSIADAAQVTRTCIAILEWGGVKPHNGPWVDTHADVIVECLQHDARLLVNPSPSLVALDRLHRFNAGFVKVYSLLLDDFIIYDGRVGAAVGALVREWCYANGLKEVPTLVCFPWGAPKEGKNARRPKNRNPSFGSLHFSSFVNRKSFHAIWTIYASWLLCAVLNTRRTRFHESPNPLRALEAALFMIGYDLGIPATAPDEALVQRAPTA